MEIRECLFIYFFSCGIRTNYFSQCVCVCVCVFFFFFFFWGYFAASQAWNQGNVSSILPRLMALIQFYIIFWKFSARRILLTSFACCSEKIHTKNWESKISGSSSNWTMVNFLISYNILHLCYVCCFFTLNITLYVKPICITIFCFFDCCLSKHKREVPHLILLTFLQDSCQFVFRNCVHLELPFTGPFKS